MTQVSLSPASRFMQRALNSVGARFRGPSLTSFGIVIAFALFLLLGTKFQATDKTTLTVEGVAGARYTPDRIHLQFGIVADGDTLKQACERLDTQIRRAMLKLKAMIPPPLHVRAGEPRLWRSLASSAPTLLNVPTLAPRRPPPDRQLSDTFPLPPSGARADRDGSGSGAAHAPDANLSNASPLPGRNGGNNPAVDANNAETAQAASPAIRPPLSIPTGSESGVPKKIVLFAICHADFPCQGAPAEMELLVESLLQTIDMADLAGVQSLHSPSVCPKCGASPLAPSVLFSARLPMEEYEKLCAKALDDARRAATEHARAARMHLGERTSITRHRIPATELEHSTQVYAGAEGTENILHVAGRTCQSVLKEVALSVQYRVKE